MSSPAVPAVPSVVPRTIAIPFAAIVLAMLPAVLDGTILATALPTIAADLGRLTDVSWIVTGYVISGLVAFIVLAYYLSSYLTR